jgi:hypothetical protein
LHKLFTSATKKRWLVAKATIHLLLEAVAKLVVDIACRQFHQKLDFNGAFF